LDGRDSTYQIKFQGVICFGVMTSRHFFKTETPYFFLDSDSPFNCLKDSMKILLSCTKNFLRKMTIMFSLDSNLKFYLKCQLWNKSAINCHNIPQITKIDFICKKHVFNALLIRFFPRIKQDNSVIERIFPFFYIVIKQDNKF
jgi:hypothetical protein